uniref:RING-type domain-containing protein n=1 Tax=Caenorhabditis japonica TaxID=281687 RepID=A0A8R1HNG6_CAEJA
MTDFESSNHGITPPKEQKNSSENDLSNLIPEYIKDLCKHPKTTELRMCYDAPTMQANFTYSITWDDALHTEDKYKKILESRRRVPDEASLSLRVSQSHSNVFAGGPPKPVEGVCDGPCKRSFPSNCLNTIGRCGHYLCNACFGIVKNSDGTNGCSSKSCYWKGSPVKTKRFYKTDVIEKQRERAREMKARGMDVSSAGSLSANNSETSIKTIKVTDEPRGSVEVKLVALYKEDPYGMMHNFNDLTASLNADVTTTLLALLKKGKPTSQGQKPEDRLQRGTLYYVALGANGKKELRRLHKKDLKGMKVVNLPEIEKTVTLVLDLDECVIFLIRNTQVIVECSIQSVLRHEKAW